MTTCALPGERVTALGGDLGEQRGLRRRRCDGPAATGSTGAGWTRVGRAVPSSALVVSGREPAASRPTTAIRRAMIVFVASVRCSLRPWWGRRCRAAEEDTSLSLLEHPGRTVVGGLPEGQPSDAWAHSSTASILGANGPSAAVRHRFATDVSPSRFASEGRRSRTRWGGGWASRGGRRRGRRRSCTSRSGCSRRALRCGRTRWSMSLAYATKRVRQPGAGSARARTTGLPGASCAGHRQQRHQAARGGRARCRRAACRG